MTKTFSRASNAKRAAAAAGIAGGNIAFRKEDDGRFTFHDTNELAVTEAAPEPAFVEAPRKRNRTTKVTVVREPALEGALNETLGKPKRVPKAKAEPAPKAESKQDRLIALLKRPEGASVTELAAEFGWQLHTVRGAVAGALKRKLGIPVEAEKDAARGGTVYRIATPSKGE